MRITGARLRQREGRWDIEVDGGRIARVVPAVEESGMERADGPRFCADPFGHPSPSGEDLLGTGPEDIVAGGRLVVPPFVENHIHLDCRERGAAPPERDRHSLRGPQPVGRAQAAWAPRRRWHEGAGVGRRPPGRRPWLRRDPHPRRRHRPGADRPARPARGQGGDSRLDGPADHRLPAERGLRLPRRAGAGRARAAGGRRRGRRHTPPGAHARGRRVVGQGHLRPRREVRRPRRRALRRDRRPVIPVRRRDGRRDHRPGDAGPGHGRARRGDGLLPPRLPGPAPAQAGRGRPRVRRLPQREPAPAGTWVWHTGSTGHRARPHNLGLQGWEVAEGNPANLIILDAATEQDAVRFDADVLLSLHEGREVFRRRPANTSWSV